MRQARKLFEDGDLVGAETWCRRALTLAPLVSDKPWYGEEVPLLGDILMAQGRSEEALECYLKEATDQRLRGALEPDDPDHPTPNLNAALAYCRLGNFEMAQKYYPDAVIAEQVSPEWLQESPGISDLRTREASLLLIRGGAESSTASYSRALPYLKAAEKLAPKNWMIVDRVGQTLYDLNRYEEAIPYYRRAMQLGGDKMPYGHRIKVEMYDWQQQNKAKENKPQRQNKPQEKAPK